MIGPTDLHHPTPEPHTKTFQVLINTLLLKVFPLQSRCGPGGGVEV